MTAQSTDPFAPTAARATLESNGSLSRQRRFEYRVGILVGAENRMSKEPTVFIVEDEEYLQEMYVSVLSRAGFRIVGIASNGNEAIESIRSLEKRPRIVMMDHRLPFKSGLEATVELLEEDPNHTVVFVSADGNMREKALKAGAAGFVTKPFSLMELIAALNEALNQ
jgi:two-component system, chemotaxis family, chemotaxis protein CheY